MKKKHFMLYLTIVFILLSLTFNVPAEKNNDEIKIVCTNSVLADFTKNICPENFTVDYIMPAGVCPAHFDISPSDVSKIINADIIISLGWEPWLSKLLKNAAITNYSEIKCSNLGEWNIPSGAKKYVSKISEELSKILTRYNQTIKMKTKSYLNQINKTAEQLKDMFTRFGYEECKVVCMQWQKDFAEWLGLNVTASFGPPETLSTRDKINVTMTAKEENAILIIDNLQSGTDFGEKLAQEVNAQHVVLNNFPGAIKKTDSYLEMINYNTIQIIQGINIYYYKQKNLGDLEEKNSQLELQRNISFALMIITTTAAVTFYLMYKKK